MPRKRRFPSTVHPNAWIAPSSLVDEVPEGYPNRDIDLTVIEENARIEEYSIVYVGANIGSNATVGTNCIIGPDAEIKFGAQISAGCHIGAEAVIGEGAELAPHCIIAPGCGIGTKAYLGPGVILLDQTRLASSDRPAAPAMVGAKARIGGGAIILAGVTIGKSAIVAAGELVDEPVPDRAIWSGGRVSGSFYSERETPTWL